MKFLKKILFLILVLGGVLFFLYQRGHIGMHTISGLFSKKIINPYDGVYSYDFSKIKKPKILESATIEKKNGYSPLTLSIQGPGASLLGYQYRSKVRNRFFKVCLSENYMILNNGELGVLNTDYCKIPKNNEFSLKFKQVSDSVLFCENCEEEDFPSYWIKSEN